ncbi:MAG: hypothetical protein ACK55Z_09345, partial [bacterium]
KGKKTYCYLDTASDGGTFPGQLASENENKNKPISFSTAVCLQLRMRHWSRTLIKGLTCRKTFYF